MDAVYAGAISSCGMQTAAGDCPWRPISRRCLWDADCKGTESRGPEEPGSLYGSHTTNSISSRPGSLCCCGAHILLCTVHV
jgi:hypothetical protein